MFCCRSWLLRVAFTLHSALVTVCSRMLDSMSTDIVGDGRTSTKSIGLGLRNISDDSGSHQSGCWQRTCFLILNPGFIFEFE